MAATQLDPPSTIFCCQAAAQHESWRTQAAIVYGHLLKDRSDSNAFTANIDLPSPVRILSMHVLYKEFEIRLSTPS